MKSDSSISSGSSLYQDRQVWSTYNSLGQVAPFEGGLPANVPPGTGLGGANDAIWTLAEHLVVGAANVVRRAPLT